MRIWHYDQKTGELTGEGVADPSPFPGVEWIIPACATSAEPPTALPERTAVVFDGEWTIVPDHRGETWFSAHGAPVVIEFLGDPAAKGLVADEPPAPDPTAPELIVYVMTKRDELIDGGFTFLGVEYQTRPTDRENIQGAATLALMAIIDGAQVGDLRWNPDLPDQEFGWIALDNSVVPMDAQTTVAFARAAASRKSALIFGARAIKDEIAAGSITTAAEVDAAFAGLA
ncbi:DUF4376 domain-containing protein [Rhodopseudomonas sp. BR0G17]|uniref:DUF4376 domain-containing protein n=1 Tax=Rhodopseudomonas sp. BR0G17 TaxID=2269368 RepID=UPI0013DF2E65|nr:DUF4376 domain-containing protein [Rhodopseudomonas sp. BR0G17]NEW96907.1 DUF4376 domain-containing protein [Rhodopseudomonas sp. BR0G17]